MMEDFIWKAFWVVSTVIAGFGLGYTAHAMWETWLLRKK
jgi:hypothetical protein